MRYDVFHAPPPILKRLEIKGYKTFDGEDHDLNLIGVRSSNRIVGRDRKAIWCILLSRRVKYAANGSG